MRYEDASGTFQASGPIANDDADTLSAGQRGPATGNLITGEGTQYGAAGADSAAGAQITAIAGKGGEDTSFSGGRLSIAGEHGRLTVDAEGNYSYLANGSVENVRDRFTYTLADNAGNSDTAALIVEIGKTPAVIKANAQQVVPGPDGVVTLPPGVDLSDVHVVGRNLVVDLPDGTQLIIIDGAVFVPQLSLGGVEVPATNVAALLIGQEIQPAAGELPPSSGGNFALPPPPLDPGIPLGDLIPPTEYNYVPPQPEEVFDILDEEPEIFIQPDGQPASVEAIDQVEEAGLPSRNGDLLNEPAGSGESADGNGADNDVTSETTSGTILIDSPDGVDSVTINDTLVTGVIGQTIEGAFGRLTITGFSGDDILYSYTLRDNTSGNDTHDDFNVVLTDDDGDEASATLRIDIIDDVPTARPDTDALAVGQFVETGNVMTDAAPGDVGDSDTNAADTVGADNARVTFIDSVNAAPGANVPNGSFIDIAGQYGTLRIFSNGDYTYTRGENSPGGVQDVFNYTLTDGDGDTSTTTLTITIPETPISIQFGSGIPLDDDVIPGAGGNPDGPEDDFPDVVGENVVNGNVNAQGGDGALTYSLQLTGAPQGFTYVAGPNGSLLIQQGGVTVITVTIDPATGAYTVTQNQPIDHPTLDGQAGDDTENNLTFPVTVRVTDVDGDFAETTGQIIVDDDTPIALEVETGGTVDEDGLAGGNAGGVNDVPGAVVIATGDVSELFSAGADQPLTFSLLTDPSGLPELTSNGAPVTYAVVGNTLTASANGSPVFTFTVNATTGEYTFTLLDQLDHPSLDGQLGDDTENPADSDLTIALGSIIQATDADGDSVTANADGLIITVDDDSPEPFEECPDDVITVNDVGSSFTGNLNLPPVGADEPGVVSFGVEDGDAVLDNEGNPVTSEGVALFYFINEDGVLEARAGDATGDVIFTITLNGDGTFTYEQVGIFGEGSGFTFDDLTSTSAGNVEFRGVGANDDTTTVDLLLSGAVGGVDSSVNTDSDSIGTANQSMDVGETVRIDLVSNLTSPAGTPSGFGYTGHVSSSSFIGLIPQVQGSQDETVAFTVWALDSNVAQGTEPDRNPAGGFSDSTITDITEVTVKDYLTGETTTVAVAHTDGTTFVDVAYGISVRVNDDGSVTFSGIQQGDSYGFSTGTGDFNAVVVQSEPSGTGESTEDSFDLGVFSIGIANAFDPFALEVPIALTDADGDSVICDIDINVGLPVEAPDITVTVNEAGLPLIGSDAASDSEVDSGNLQTLVTGGTGPYTFVLVGSGNGTFGNLVLNTDGTFTYTLDTTFDSQPDADDGTNPELGAETFTFEATDSLGAKQTGTITVNIIDDVPSVVVSGPATVTEGQTINGTWDDVIGADQAGATAVAVFNGSEFALGTGINTGKGTLTVNADGTWSFQAVNNLDNDVLQQISFSVQVTDGDGDVAEDPHTITINDGPPPSNSGPISLEVDDDALSNGSNAVSTDEVDSDTITFNAGSDALTVAFGNSVASLGGGLTWTRVNDTTIEGRDGGNLIVTLSLSGTLSIAAGASGNVTVTATLADNYDSHPTFTADDLQALGNVLVVASDQDGDSTSAQVNVSVSDDVPDNDVAGPTAVVEGQSINGTWTAAPGADQPGHVTVVTFGGSDYALGTPINTGNGTLTVFANGTWTFSSTTDGSISFTLKTTDADGDVATDPHTITISDGAGPQGGDTLSLEVDDDALSDGNNSASTDETASGTLTFTAGADPLTTFAFGTDLTGLDPSLTWVRVDGDTIEGRDGGTLIVTLQLTAPGSIAANTSGDVTVTATLSNNYDSHPTFTADDLKALGSVSVVASEADPSDFATGTVSVSVSDDVPDNDVAGSTTVVEGQATNGTWTAAPGADQPGHVTVVTFAGVDYALGTPINTGKGTLTVAANGTWSFTAVNNLDNDVAQSISFTLKTTDADGDVATDPHTINITDGAGPTGGDTLSLEVDDEALPQGTNSASTAENASGTLTFTAGSDALSGFAFAAGTGTLGAGLTWIRVSDTLIEGYDGATKIVSIALVAPGAPIAPGATGDVTINVTLHDNYDSHPGINADDLQALGTVTVVASDHDGDSATGTVSVGVSDDVPLNFTPVDLTDKTGATVTTLDDALVNDGTANVIRVLNNTNADLSTGENFIGADGFGDIVFTAAGHTNGEALESTGGTPLTSGGDPIYLFGFGTGVLTATTSATNSDAGAVVFTVTLTEGAGFGSASTYEVEFFQTIDDGSGFVFDDFSTAPAGQNDWVGLDADGLDINDPTDPNANSEDLLLTPTNVGGSINTSATDIGNANQWVDTGEGVRLDYVVDVRRDPGSDEKDIGGYAFDGHYNVTDSSFKIMQTQGGGTAAVRITAFNDPDTGTLDTLSGAIVPIDPASIVVTGDATYTVTALADGSVVVSGLNPGATVEFEAVGDVFFNSYSITNANGLLNTATPAPGDTFTSDAFAIGVFGFNSETAGSPIDMSFDLTASDADGDTSTGTLDISLVPADSQSLSLLAESSFSTQSESKIAANDDYSSLLVGDSVQKLNYGNAFGNVGNTGITSAMVAASGFAMMSSSLNSFSQPSFDSLVQDSFQSFSAQVVGRESLAEDYTSMSIDGGYEPTFDAVSLSSSSFSFEDSAFEGGSLDAMSFGDAGPAYVPSYASGEAASANVPAFAANVPAVSMASAEMLQALSLEGNAQQGGAVEQILAEALDSRAATIDSILANLPGGIGEVSSIAHLASPDGTGVPAWDMGMQGGFAPMHDMLFKVAAVEFHQDAVQPA